MGIFDVFSNSDANNAAAAQTGAIEQGVSQLNNYYGQGSNALTTNYMQGLQPLLNNYNNSNAGVSQLMALLGISPPAGSSGNGAASGTAAPAASGAPAGTPVMGNDAASGNAAPGTSQGGAPATGMTSTAAANPTGTSGNIQATLANLPGYQFALNQGSQNVLRNQSATGQLNSGATNVDLTNYGQGLASQNYNNYVSQLQPFLGSSNANAAGISGLYSGLGNALNSNLTNQGNAALSANTAIGNAQAQADYANLAASGGLWGGLLSAGANAAGAYLKSDERAKEDIEPVGELFDGTNVYRYRYRGDRHHQIGVLAQEVEKSNPAAVKEFGGVKHVHYDRATNYAAELGRMLKAA